MPPPLAWLARPSWSRLTVSQRRCRTRRLRRRVLCTSVRPRWRLPTRKASRSARKVSGLTHQGGGGNPAALFPPCIFERDDRQATLSHRGGLRRPGPPRRVVESVRDGRRGHHRLESPGTIG